jgi:hypothetical protein
MPDESHLDEMREAIRGDFERLAERLGEQQLLHVAEPDDVPDEAESMPEIEAEIEAEVDAEERRSWLARLLSP